MIILGIDPGTTSLGFAIISNDQTPVLLHSGLIAPDAKNPGQRLKDIHNALKNIIASWQPQMLSLEKLFFAKNSKTAFAVSEARGVILLTSTLADIPVYEYTPLQVKKIVTGDGGADKMQMQKMVELIFPHLKAARTRDDVYDAVAIALSCALSTRQYNNYP